MNPGQLSLNSRDQKPSYEIWGLTGGIASGKSTAAKIFEENGIPVVDADRIARALSAPGGAAHPAILKRFGTADRGELRKIVFSDPAARRDLEAIMHPLILAESMSEMEKLARAALQTTGKRPVRILYEAALLVETGRYQDFRGLIVIEAPQDLRQKRIVARDAVSPELAARIMGTQTGDELRRKAATHIIENSGGENELRQKLVAFLKEQGWI